MGNKTVITACAALWGAALAAPPALAGQSEGGDRDGEPLVVCAAELQPWIYAGEDGTVTGYEVDAVTAWADSAGRAVTFALHDFADLLPTLTAGECDMIASGFSITLDRIAEVDFSVPYNQTTYHLVTTLETAEDKETLDWFDGTDRRIGHLAGGLSGEVAAEFFPAAELVPLKTRADAIAAFRDGAIDAYVASSPFDRILIEAAPDNLYAYDEVLRISIEAMAVQKDNEALVDALNPWIVARVADNTFRDLHRQWFSESALFPDRAGDR